MKNFILSSLLILTLLLPLASAKLTTIEGEIYAIWINYPNENPQYLRGNISGNLTGKIFITSYPDWQTNIEPPKIGTSNGEFNGTMTIDGIEYECEGVFVTTIINNAYNKGTFDPK